MYFYTSNTQILPSESMKCNRVCVRDQTMYREKQLPFGAILESMLSLLALLIYLALVLLLCNYNVGKFFNVTYVYFFSTFHV